MTPERALYHLLMLRLGMPEEYDRELDRLLVEEDPLSPLVLDLAVCMSDRNQTISVLWEYTLDHPADQEQVYELILAELRRQYAQKRMDADRVCTVMRAIARNYDYDYPWFDFYEYLQDLELFEDGFLSREVYEAAFDARFLRGEQVDELVNVWTLQKEVSKKKSILDLFRRKT